MAFTVLQKKDKLLNQALSLIMDVSFMVNSTHSESKDSLCYLPGDQSGCQLHRYIFRHIFIYVFQMDVWMVWNDIALGYEGGSKKPFLLYATTICMTFQ